MGWEIDGIIYPENPRLSLPEEYLEMINIWQNCRASSTGGERKLPDAGGVFDQSSLMMDALQIMENHFQTFKKD